MASPNIEALKDVYEHWGRGDWEYIPPFYSPDFEWGWSEEFPGLAGVIHDTRSPNPRLQTWLSPWEHWHVEVEEYLEQGDTVIVLARYRGRGKGSGVDVDVAGAHVWRMRDGIALRLEVFNTREAALKQHEAPPSGGASRDTSRY
jgi:ketosteroid isomerase-like protein